MRRFINSRRQTVQNKAITDFTKESTAITSGYAKGYSSHKFAWVADFLYKHKGNVSIKPHTCYNGFYSIRDILQNEYGNDATLYTKYPCLSDYPYAIFPENYFELSTKQYSKVGQSLSEYDVIDFINLSNTDDNIIETNISVIHKYYKIPAFYAQGYKFDLQTATVDFPGWKYYSRYVFTNNDMISSYNAGLSEFVINLLQDEDDVFTPAMEAIFASQNPDRIFNYNGVMDSTLHYTNEALLEWMFNREIVAGTEDYCPYFGLVQCFDEGLDYIIDGQTYLFFPETIDKGAVEPSKIITSFSSEQMGSLAYNDCIHNKMANDQSRVVYNICKHMLRRIPEEGVPRNSSFELKKHGKYFEDVILYGIDTETERNRRHSAVVTTEPYMVTTPIADGQFVDISFVDYAGNPIDMTTEDQFLNNPAMYLKIKGPSSFFKDLNYHLSLKEYNTDIIDTVIIKNPRSEEKYNLFNQAGDNLMYEDFGTDQTSLLKRQEFCLDDFVYGYIGSELGKHIVFWINGPGDIVNKYRDGKAIVCGAGFYCKTIVDSNKKILPEHDEYLTLYCTGFEPTSAPENDSNEPVPVPNVLTLLVDNGAIDKASEYERFRPMIKLPGINGFIKILEQNNHFKIKRANDGDYEIIYNVEFPFCPGSYIERMTMSFNDDHPSLSTQVLYKKNYINAGSWKVIDSGLVYDSTNNRYAPYGNDAFNPHQIFTTHHVSESGYNIIENPEYPDRSDIPSYVHIDEFGLVTLDPEYYYNDIIPYPEHLVFKYINADLMTIVKPMYENYQNHGMYTLILTEGTKVYEELVIPNFSSDIKILSQANNATWKFDNKYIGYLGNENPSRIFKVDVSALFDDITTYQKDHGAIPDMKRWLYAYFKGFAYMASIPENRSSSKKIYTDIDNSELLISQDSDSSIVIEVWDSQSDVGHDKKGNWRPLNVITTDNEKVQGENIINNLVLLSEYLEYQEDLGLWRVHAVYCNDPDYFTAPIDVEVELKEKNSLVVFNPLVGTDGENLHVAYVDTGTVMGQNTIILYIKDDANFATDWAGVITSIEDIPAQGSVSIYKPMQCISKDPEFTVISNKVSGIESVTRYIDIRSEGDPSDFLRYVIDGYIYFRARVRRSNNAPACYIDEDLSEVQSIGSPSVEGYPYNPWMEDGVFKDEFSWSGIEYHEYIYRFGFSYFKCASK